ncbi:MAG: C40 family peptidase, partial [Fidelibacterota bacterium]
DDWLLAQGWDHYTGWVSRSQVVVSDEAYAGDVLALDYYGLILNEEGNRPPRPITQGARLKTVESNRTLVVELPDGTRGNYSGRWTSENLSPTPENIVQTTKSFLGIPYIWGGRSPWGFDCSGLIQTIFSRCGITLPRDAGLQKEFLRQAIIAPEEAEPGDLFFFSRGQKITHVGLALGNNQILHAQGWVRIESLDATMPDANPDLINRLNAICSTQTLQNGLSSEPGS